MRGFFCWGQSLSIYLSALAPRPATMPVPILRHPRQVLFVILSVAKNLLLQNAAPGFSPKRGCCSEDEYISAKTGKFNCIYKYQHYRK